MLVNMESLLLLLLRQVLQRHILEGWQSTLGVVWVFVIPLRMKILIRLSHVNTLQKDSQRRIYSSLMKFRCFQEFSLRIWIDSWDRYDFLRSHSDEFKLFLLVIFSSCHQFREDLIWLILRSRILLGEHFVLRYVYSMCNIDRYERSILIQNIRVMIHFFRFWMRSDQVIWVRILTSYSGLEIFP